MGLPRRIFHTAKTVSHLGHFRRLLGSLPRECVCASKKLVPHSLSFDTKLRTLKKIKSSSFRCTFGLDENVCEKCNSFGVERALWVKNHKKIFLSLVYIRKFKLITISYFAPRKYKWVMISLLIFLFLLQNFTLRNLDKHTKYQVTVAARNYVGLGPSDVIELRTEDGGKLNPIFKSLWRIIRQKWPQFSF